MIKLENPFMITTPENYTAEEMLSLFVDVFDDFKKIVDPGHVFLLGPRGAGKSMMFRYMKPDCQCLEANCDVTDLKYIGVYSSLKNAHINIAELLRLENKHASEILNEHIMVVYFGISCFETLSNLDFTEIDLSECEKIYNKFYSLFSDSTPEFNCKNIKEVFVEITDNFKLQYIQVMKYVKKLSFTGKIIPYEGLLFDYLDYFIPLIDFLHSIKGFPACPIYLLIDDAHCLTETQTRILNTWVSSRTSRTISLKISSQYNYKSYYTTTYLTIDTPHDYTEIDMATIYTGKSKSPYRKRIIDIVEKRLKIAGIDKKAVDFFPEDTEQENKIREIAEKYRRNFDEGKGRGTNRSDDALRYARPDFIKSLAGTSKSSHTYSYSSLDQLIHLSSGIVRYFLESSHEMYAKELSRKGSLKVDCISPSIQDEVIRDNANNFLLVELDRYAKDSTDEDNLKVSDIEIMKLRNLIEALGKMFRRTLLSNRSERRVFSVAISDKISKEVKDIFDLGILLGYFHKSTIGNKNPKSGGRTILYVMNKRLAPMWTLDPTGFSGYLFIKNEMLEEALVKPESLIKRVDKESLIDEENDFVQLTLFDDISIDVCDQEE